MKILRVFLLFGSIVSVYCQATANECLDATTVTELKRDFPVVIVGKVLKKNVVTKETGAINLSIKVVRYLKGNLGAESFEGLTFKRWPDSEKEFYKINEEYVFPVQKYDIKTKGKEYDVVVPDQECGIIRENKNSNFNTTKKKK